MARIRSIKPEFPQSESTGRLSRDARLLFIQIWTVVDDEGRTRAASRMLASLLYPYDDDAPKLIEGWLAELERQGCIRRYVVDGNSYLEIANWLKHQKIDHPTKSRLPSPSDSLASPREPSRNLAPDLGSRILDQKERGKNLSPSSSDKNPRNWPEDYAEIFWKAYPRKVGRKAALAKLLIVRKTGEIDFPDLIRSVGGIEAREERFIPHPTTWLNEGRYLDPLYSGKPPPVVVSEEKLVELRAKYEQKMRMADG